MRRFQDLIEDAISFDQHVYRSSSPKYATEADLLTGVGASSQGGRWNPKGLPMVYASFDAHTAVDESLAHFRYYGIAEAQAMPRTIVAVRARLATVFDFRSGQLRRRLRVSERSVLDLDWRRDIIEKREPLTQLIGRAAHTAGWEGLVVPSAARRGGHNLLAFPDRLAEGSGFEIVNAAQL